MNRVPSNTRLDALYIHFWVFILLWKQRYRLVKELDISQQGWGKDPGEVPAPGLLLLHPSIESPLSFSCSVLNEPIPLPSRVHTWGQIHIVRRVLTIGIFFISWCLASSHDYLKEPQTQFVHSLTYQISVTAYSVPGQV